LLFRTMRCLSGPAPTAVHTLSLHDALPILLRAVSSKRRAALQIHPIQQVLCGLCPQDQSHHAPGTQARRDHAGGLGGPDGSSGGDRKSTRLNSSHVSISYAVFCLKKKTINE